MTNIQHRYTDCELRVLAQLVEEKRSLISAPLASRMLADGLLSDGIWGYSVTDAARQLVGEA